jgi:DDE superfamily endonuclease
LYAAFNFKSGEVVGACHPRHTAVEFLDFLNVLHRRYPVGACHVILDNSSTHATPVVHAWLDAHPRVQFPFTPTGPSWLNLVEVWFSILTRNRFVADRSRRYAHLSRRFGVTLSAGTKIRAPSCGPSQCESGLARVFFSAPIGSPA